MDIKMTNVTEEIKSDMDTTLIKDTKCYCEIDGGRKRGGIIQCSKQVIPFNDNYTMLESRLYQYQRTMSKKKRMVADRVTETKIYGMMEVWDHIMLFGGFIEIEDAWKRYRCHQSSSPNKERFVSDILDGAIGLSIHIVQFQVLDDLLVKLIMPKDTVVDMGILTEYIEK